MEAWQYQPSGFHVKSWRQHALSEVLALQFAANGFVVSLHIIGGWGYTVHLGSWDVWGDVLMPVEDKGVREGAPRQFGKVCQDEQGTFL